MNSFIVLKLSVFTHNFFIRKNGPKSLSANWDFSHPRPGLMVHFFSNVVFPATGEEEDGSQQEDGLDGVGVQPLHDHQELHEDGLQVEDQLAVGQHHKHTEHGQVLGVSMYCNLD